MYGVLTFRHFCEKGVLRPIVDLREVQAQGASKKKGTEQDVKKDVKECVHGP